MTGTNATLGSTAFVRMRCIGAFHDEITARPYADNRPHFKKAPRDLQLGVIDPFGNRIRYCEDAA